jgi:hypothetical protein
VDLLHEGSQPDGVHPQAVEVPLLDFPEDPGEIPALEAAQQRSILSAAEGAIVAGIAVLEAINQQKVDGGTIPERRRLGDADLGPKRACGEQDCEKQKRTTETRRGAEVMQLS